MEWTQVANIPRPAAGHVCSLIDNWKVLLVGGSAFHVDEEPYKTTFFYNPSTNVWINGP